jgi:aryl-alcohol dehydrogenase-like predicted oxidoreductase
MTRRDRLVLGTADLRDDAAAAALLDRFAEAGGTAIDLANVYADGESERGVGRWLRRTAAAPTLYVKGCHPPYCVPELVPSEVDKAREDLGVDRLDVFILHRDDETVPVESFAEALQGEVARGSVGSFGVSNWRLERFDELARALGPDRSKLTVLSNHFSLATMVTPTWPGCLAMDRAQIDALAGTGTTVLAWASLAAGYFAGLDSPSWDSAENAARRTRAAATAAEWGTTATGIALAYVLHQPDYVRPVIGTTSEAHLDELFRAADVELTDSELAGAVAGP